MIFKLLTRSIISTFMLMDNKLFHRQNSHNTSKFIHRQYEQWNFFFRIKVKIDLNIWLWKFSPFLAFYLPPNFFFFSIKVCAIVKKTTFRFKSVRQRRRSRIRVNSISCWMLWKSYDKSIGVKSYAHYFQLFAYKQQMYRVTLTFTRGCAWERDVVQIVQNLIGCRSTTLEEKSWRAKGERKNVNHKILSFWKPGTWCRLPSSANNKRGYVGHNAPERKKKI